MNLNDVLMWIAGGNCAIMLWLMRGRGRADHRHWTLPLVGVLLVLLLGRLAAPDIIGYVSGAMWAAFVLVPFLGWRYLQTLALRREYEQAVVGHAWLRWLHPARDWHYESELWRAMAMAARGEFHEAVELARILEAAPDPVGARATACRLVILNRWDGIAAWFEEELAGEDLELQLMVLPTYLRALGETGRLDRLVAAYHHFVPLLDAPGMGLKRGLCRLAAAAYCGRIDLVQEVLTGSFRDFPGPWRQLWVLIAHEAAGNTIARQRLAARLAGRLDAVQVNQLRRRENQPLAAPSAVLQEAHWEMLRELGMELAYDRAERQRLAQTQRRPIALYVLIALNVLMWLVEVRQGGSENMRTLERLGALYPPYVLEGDWWRVPMAMFMHSGFAHLALNMLGLWILGGLVARLLGASRFVLVYLLAGLGSMVILVAVDTLRGDPQVVVGASGAIMGLAGALVAVFWRSWWRTRGELARQRLVLVVLVVVFQAVFDHYTPEVSALAHASGAALGLLVTMFLKHQTESALPFGRRELPHE